MPYPMPDDSEYRAAYWHSKNEQDSVVLTLPEHATLSDDDLMAEARAEMRRIKMTMGGGTIKIGMWVTR